MVKYPLGRGKLRGAGGEQLGIAGDREDLAAIVRQIDHRKGVEDFGDDFFGIGHERSSI